MVRTAYPGDVATSFIPFSSIRRRVAGRSHRVAADPRATTDSRPYCACYAPAVLLYFQPDGDVRACCRNQDQPLGNIGRERLPDIWNGARRQKLQRLLSEDDFSFGCRSCEWEIETVGREHAYPEQFGPMATHLTSDPASGAWPRRMEFNLSNSCNLQCIQCNGALSSSIRIHREGRPPLPKVYDDQFFADLRPFLPHLELAQFAGGEPFLGAENFIVWDLMAEVAPHVSTTVVTNATQWNKRVERVLEKLALGFCFSIDGIGRETYESIRIDADYDEVMTNLDRFCNYARRRGTSVAINYCLMVQNFHEFGEMLVFAERRGIAVNVSVVHYPAHTSIARQPQDKIAEIYRTLQDQSADVLAQLDLNARCWIDEVDRIRQWMEGDSAAADHEATWMGSPTILGLARAGTGPTDDAAARSALEHVAADGVVHHLDIDQYQRIQATSDSVLDLFGPDRDLVGLPIDDLLSILTERFGPAVGDTEFLSRSADQLGTRATYGSTVVRATAVALRDDAGWADGARLLFAIQK